MIFCGHADFHGPYSIRGRRIYTITTFCTPSLFKNLELMAYPRTAWKLQEYASQEPGQSHRISSWHSPKSAIDKHRLVVTVEL
jgi:hypothetical protein